MAEQAKAKPKEKEEIPKAQEQEDRFVGNKFLDQHRIKDSYHYRVASYLNSHPEKISEFFEKSDSLKIFANIYTMLKHDIRLLAVKIASRIIIKIAAQIADTGYASGKLKLIKGINEGTDIDIDNTLENCIENPEKDIVENIVTYTRDKEQKAIVIMLDHSYSMKGMKIILAAITAAAVAKHFKKHYAILSFNNRVEILKALDQKIGPEEVISKLFTLELQGDTNIRLALETGLRQVKKYEKKIGILLTDGAWNQGGDPLKIAAQFGKLSVIAFPPAKAEKVKQLALKGKGEFSFAEDESDIVKSILKCLN